MDINELTTTMHRFVESKGWYAPESKRPQTPRNIAISLSLEVAEVLEHFQWRDAPVNKEDIGGELADVMFYLLQLAEVLEINLEQATTDKMHINYSRTWDNEPPCTPSLPNP